MKNDIALIKLKDPVPKFTKFITPICLPESTTQFGTDDCCTLAGWGKTAADEKQLRKFIDIEKAYSKKTPGYTPLYDEKTPLFPQKPRMTVNIIEPNANCFKQYGSRFG